MRTFPDVVDPNKTYSILEMVQPRQEPTNCSCLQTGTLKTMIRSLPCHFIISVRRDRFQNSRVASGKPEQSANKEKSNTTHKQTPAEQGEKAASKPANLNDTQMSSVKITAAVNFPLEEFSWPTSTENKNDDKFVIYGLCMHAGTSLNGGHYTAFCREDSPPTPPTWTLYNDSEKKVDCKTSEVEVRLAIANKDDGSF